MAGTGGSAAFELADAAKLARDLEAEHAEAVAERETERLWEHRPARPDPKPAKRASRTTAPRPDRLWRERVLERDQGCCVHTNPADCREWFQAHHVVAQQILRLNHADQLWHPLAGMGVCGLVHRRHHSAAELIPLWAIPLPVVDFLSGLGFGWYIERHYPA